MNAGRKSVLRSTILDLEFAFPLGSKPTPLMPNADGSAMPSGVRDKLRGKRRVQVSPENQAKVMDETSAVHNRNPKGGRYCTAATS